MRNLQDLSEIQCLPEVLSEYFIVQPFTYDDSCDKVTKLEHNT